MTPNAQSLDSSAIGLNLPRIVSAQQDRLIDSNGRQLIDLFSGNGAALLGHAHPKISAAIKNQLDLVWLTGGLPTPANDLAKAALESLLPERLRLSGFYSTGMEATEFAMRMARGHTGRSDFVGFSCAMHGKSCATAALSWDNAPTLPHIHRLPSLLQCPEDEVLDHLDRCLQAHPVAAVFLEPVMGTRGGYIASAEFRTRLIELCRAFGTLVVMDEILTGLYRTGPRWTFQELDILPDIALLGKALGNGFPVAAVVSEHNIKCTAEMLPGSTFAGNPLATTAVVATLNEVSLLDLPGLVDAIARTVQTSLAEVLDSRLKGRGALWMIEMASPNQAKQLAEAIYRQGVFLSYTGNYIRVLPSATIAQTNLAKACGLLRQLVEAMDA